MNDSQGIFPCAIICAFFSLPGLFIDDFENRCPLIR